MKKSASITAALAATAIIAGCSTDADMASHNLSKAAEQFEIERRIVFYNGITGGYMLTIQGLCSIEADGADNQLEVTCKTAENQFKKHYLGLSDNVTYFAEQLAQSSVDVYRYRVVFKPESLIPNVDLETSMDKQN